jgi:hypothetical protein
LSFESLEAEFTPSVRAEIGQVRETETGARQGELTDMELPQIIAEVQRIDAKFLSVPCITFGW